MYRAIETKHIERMHRKTIEASYRTNTDVQRKNLEPLYIH